MSGHGGGRIIQYDQDHVSLVVNGIDNAGDRGGEECGISDESETRGVRLDFPDTLGNVQSGSHTETGVDHIKRHSVAKSITSDITTENRLLSFHGFFDCIERSSVRTSGAKYRWTDRKCRRLWKLRCDSAGQTKKSINI